MALLQGVLCTVSRVSVWLLDALESGGRRETDGRISLQVAWRSRLERFVYIHSYMSITDPSRCR